MRFTALWNYSGHFPCYLVEIFVYFDHFTMTFTENSSTLILFWPLYMPFNGNFCNCGFDQFSMLFNKILSFPPFLLLFQAFYSLIFTLCFHPVILMYIFAFTVTFHFVFLFHCNISFSFFLC